MASAATTASRAPALPRLNTLQPGRILPIDAFRGLTYLVILELFLRRCWTSMGFRFLASPELAICTNLSVTAL